MKVPGIEVGECITCYWLSERGADATDAQELDAEAILNGALFLSDNICAQASFQMLKKPVNDVHYQGDRFHPLMRS